MSAKSNKRPVTIEGREFESIQSAADAFAMSRNTLDYRLSKGWSPEEAVGLKSRPSHAGRTPGVAISLAGQEFESIKDAAKYFGRSYTWIFQRLKRGDTVEQALGLAQPECSLQTVYPELARQWHPTKNEPLTADIVDPNSGHIAWWLCPDGHEWSALITSRINGSGCAICKAKRPKSKRGMPSADWNFATEYPDLLEQWDWDKNAPIDPRELAPRSSKKVWWICEKGHSWQAYITNRTRPNAGGCPFCSNKRLYKDKSNSLAKMRPDIAKDWHPHNNKPLTPNDVLAGGSKKVWWICKHGHEWKTTVGLRVIAGTGCPKCSLQTSRVEIAVYSELDALFESVSWREKIAGYECDIYLREENIGIEIDGVYWHSRNPDAELAKSKAFESEGIQLFRLREYGLDLLSERDVSFKWAENNFIVISRLICSLLRYANLAESRRTKLREYADGPGLVNEYEYRKIVATLPAPPAGQSLADMQPQIAKQWAYDLNAPLLPEHFRHQAGKRVWWRCEEGHTWKVSINNRTQHGTGCPHCPRQCVVTVTEDWNLAAINPELANEWHPEKNGDKRPEDIRPRSNLKAWWKCSEGHEWEAVVASRMDGNNCPYCSGRFASEANNLAVKFPDLMEEWDLERNEGLDPSSLTPYCATKVWWVCGHGHSWQAQVSNRTRLAAGCPLCARSANRRYSIEDFQEIAAKRGGKCLSREFTSVRNRLKFRCKEGHTWETRADGVLYDNKWCPVCGRNRNTTSDRQFSLF